MSKHLKALPVLLWFLFAVSSASAQSRADVERAMSQGAFQEASRLADDAMAMGALPRDDLAALLFLQGLAQVNLGAVSEAQRSFVRALALEPELKLGADESIRTRSVFMEARGFWSAHPRAFDASAKLTADGSILRVVPVDPAGMAARVLIRVRVAPQMEFVEQAFEPVPEVQVRLPGAGPKVVECTVAFIDENANRVFEYGTDAQPIRLELSPAPSTIVATEMQPLSPPPTVKNRKPYFWAAGVSLAVGLGSLGIAGFANVERQQLARDWNAARCDGPGVSRGAVCGDERDRIEMYERLAMGLYSVGGAAIVAGVVLLLVAPRSVRVPDHVQQAFRCHGGPGEFGVGCAGSF